MSDTSDPPRPASEDANPQTPPAEAPSAQAKPAPSAAPDSYGASQAASDLTGMPLGRQLIITLWHTVAFTPRVVRAMMERTPAYLPPLRLFMILMGLLLGVGAFFQLPLVLDTSSLFPEVMQDDVDAYLREAGTSLQAANAETGRWMSLVYWIMMAISALPFLIMLKALRPGLSWWTHLQGYLTANNALLIVMLAGVPLLLISPDAFIAFQLPVMALFYVAMVRIAVGAYRLRTVGVAVLTIAMVPLTLLTMLIGAAINLASLHLVLMLAYDVSLIDLFNVSAPVTPPGDLPS